MAVLVVPWCVGAVVVAVVLWRALSPRSGRVVGMPDAPVGVWFTGGLRSRTLNAPWPLARLEFHDWGIRLAGRDFPVLGRLVPRWEARYAELAGAGLIRRPGLGSGGVRFWCGDGRPAVVFWTGRDREVLTYLESRGVRVERSESRLPWIGGP